MNNIKHLFILFSLTLFPFVSFAQGFEESALKVINRWTKDSMPVKVMLSLDKDSMDCDQVFYYLNNDTLVIEASSPVSACYGFYHWAKSKNAGIFTWNGSRFEKPKDIFTKPTTLHTPYRDHQYFNVVTYGYTTAYWDKERWDKEIDWMALHGIDMPLFLLAQEYVEREVFKDMGLSDEELNEWEVGPSHLPWKRMGNLSGNSFDGPLGKDWPESQMELALYVMNRMKDLGMKPICPAFGGFVPKAIANHYHVTLDTTGWDWMPKEYCNYRVRPDSPLFAEIGTRFIQKWESHFGKGKYYLSDSFNEMEIPSDTNLMAKYGEAVYRSIHNANPEAVWVMQGWTLGYQRWQWGNGIFSSLTKHVPQDRFYLLDMATDYNCCFWKNSFNWEYYNSFNGHPWVWSVIPNMGGKTAFTGMLEHYANGRILAQQSENRGKLIGFGMAPEGLDNNEMIYDLLCDAAYKDATEEINLEEWIKEYLRCRYGVIPPMEEFYTSLLQSIYSSFLDHPQFGWQVRNNIIRQGSVATDSLFCQQVEHLLSHYKELEEISNSLSKSEKKLLEADLIEIAALYLAHKVETINSQITKALDNNDKTEAHKLLSLAEKTMLELDAILEKHPTYKLSRWEKQAINQANNKKDRKRNAINARRIVSVWYGDHKADEPVNDYSCRLWSGLIRDYYLPRMKETWLKKIDNKDFDQIAFENKFVNKAPKLSKAKKINNKNIISHLTNLIFDKQ